MASTEATSSSGPVQTQPDEASSQGEPQQAEPASPAGEAEARRQQQPASTNPASPPAQGPPPAVAALSTRIDSNANASNSAPLIARSQGERGCMDCDCLPWASHPLFDAAAQGDREAVSAMLKKDIRLVKATVGGRHYTAWHVAAERGHVCVLEELLAAVLDCKEAVEQLNNSLRRLFAMARTGERLARYFLNGRCKGGATPLVVAARAGQVSTVSYLLSVGANAWLADSNGLTALHIAAIHNRNEVIHEMCRQPIPYSRLAHTCNTANTKYVDVSDPFGWTPLHHACLASQCDAIKTLLSHDANIIARTQLHNMKLDLLPTGLTPLHLAAYKGNLTMAKILLRAYYEDSADLLPSQTALFNTTERRRRQRSQPDPRLMLTRTARLPYHFAHRLQHTHMLEWLDPSIPLMFLFAGTGIEDGVGDGGDVRVGVPRLTVLAATALHQHLTAQLEAAEQQLQQRQQQQQDDGTQTTTLAETSKGTNLGGTVKSLLFNTLNRTRVRQTNSSSGGAPPVTSRPSCPAPTHTDTTATATHTLTHTATAGPGPSQPQLQPAGSSQPSPSPLRPRRHSNPISAGGASRAEKDVLYVGEQAGLMLRLKQGVRMARHRPGQVVSKQALQRMGIAIPDNVDNEPVAQLRLGQCQPSLADLSLVSTWHPSHPHTHSSLFHTVAGTRPARDEYLGRQSAEGRGSAADRRGGRRGSASAGLRASEPGMVSHARAAADAAAGAADSSMLGTHFLTAEPPTPYKDEFAEHPFELSADEKLSIAQTWPFVRAPSTTSEPSRLGPTGAAAAGDDDQLLSRISEQTEQTHGAASQINSPHGTQPWSIPSIHSTTASVLAPHSDDAAAAAATQPAAQGANTAGPTGLFARNQVHPEPSCSVQVAGGHEKTKLHPDRPAGGKDNSGAGATQSQSGAQQPQQQASSSNGAQQQAQSNAGQAQTQDDDDEEDVCPVCLDELPNIIVPKCKHKLCMGCAKDLIQRHKLTPALCPYCRLVIPGLALIT